MLKPAILMQIQPPEEPPWPCAPPGEMNVGLTVVAQT